MFKLSYLRAGPKSKLLTKQTQVGGVIAKKNVILNYFNANCIARQIGNINWKELLSGAV